MRHLKSFATVAGLFAATVFFQPGVARADYSFQVTLDTAALVAASGGPFYLDFALTDGSGNDPANANNVVTLTGFSFTGGGNITDVPVREGGATGGVGGTVRLQDTTFFNGLYQRFAAGTGIRFQVNTTTNPNANGVPDRFTVGILRGDLSQLPTLADDSVSLLTMDIDGVTPTIAAYGTDPAQTAIILAPPVVGAVTVPEPASLLLLLLVGVAGVGHRLARRKRTAPPPIR